MRRREFVGLLGGAAAWPLAAYAQQPERMRRIGILMDYPPGEPEGQARIAAFLEGLQEHGWAVDHSLQIETRWASRPSELMRKHAEELIALAPEVILASGTATLGPLLQATRQVPVVFASVADPVGAGFVKSLARPGGNATGFTVFEYGLSAKWLEMLKELAPRVRRAAVLREPALTSGIAQFAAIQSLAPSVGVEAVPVDVRNADEIERTVTEFAAVPDGGIVVTASAPALVHRDLIVKLAARHELPAVYSNRLFVTSGGLASYSPDRIDQFRRAAGYVDRILKGEKPADLPVQAPTKYETVLNLKAAKLLGLDVPATVLARADEVIE